MSFSEAELAYIRSRRLLRLSTVGPDGQPDVVPVGFDFDGGYFYVGGAREPERTRKFRNVRAGNVKVALVLDDSVPGEPRRPRMLRVYGTADFVEREGYAGPGTYLRIAPVTSWSGNLDDRPFGPDHGGPYKTVHRPG